MTALLKHGRSQAEIAAELGRARSTISRELRRNVTHHDGHYRAEKAQQYSVARRRRERRRSWFSAEQMAEVDRLLKKKWSPEQIADDLKRRGVCRISHETIYRHILRDKKRGGSLYTHMRIMSKKVRKRYNSKDSRGVLAGKRHISERPIEAEKRLQVGHWEGDTVIGQDKHACILTMVDRRSGYAVIKKLKARTAEQATKAAALVIAEQAGKVETITLDNGTEFHSYAQLERDFATPYHSWERGSNENLNGLIRQYLPRGTCMKRLTQKECDWIANELNTRPRKRHGFRTPAEIYHAS
jgi:IS30 family transposase